MSSREQRYLQCMVQMKSRLYFARDTADGFLSSDNPSVFDFELACLQLRKAIELIGFAAMVAESHAYKEIKRRLDKEWNFKDILERIQRISPDSFPMGVSRQSSTQPGVKWHFVPQDDFAIPPSTLIEWHGTLHKHLHATNPFRDAENMRHYSLRIKAHVSDILSYLENHLFMRADRTGGYLVTLNGRDEPVTINGFERTQNV